MKSLTFVYMGVMPDTTGNGENFTEDIYSEPLHQASVLEQAGFTVDFRNFTGHPYRDPLADPENLIDFLKDCHHLLYVFTYIFSMPYVTAALRVLKERRPELRTALGGIGPNLAPEGIIEAFPFIDAVVMGEGELILPGLMEALLSGEKELRLPQVPGICYRTEKGPCSTALPGRITDLDSLPPAAYHLLDIRPHERINLLFSRGCPHSCSFCDDLTYWQGIRVERSVPHVLSEVQRLAEDYGVTRFIIADDVFAMNRERAIAFSQGIRELSMPLRWEILTRIDCLDEEAMSEMARSGCFCVMVGIESGSQEILNRVHKKLDLQKAVEGLRRACGHFERVTTFFIWGFPFEEMGDFRQTLSLMTWLSERMGCEVRLNSLLPIQHSPLYRTYGADVFFSEEYVPFDKSRFYIKNEALELVKRYPQIFASFYTYPTPGFTEKKRILKRLFDSSQPSS